MPFGVFGERLHPSWINKLPSGPPVFGHAHGGVAEDALLPVLSDAGIMVRFNQPLSDNWHLDLSAYATQGPQLAPDADDHADPLAAAHSPVGLNEVRPVARAVGDHGDGAELPAPAVAFGTAFGDNNKNKMLGGRLGFVKGPSFVEWRRGRFEVRGEGVLTRQEFIGETDFETLEQSGFYAQLAHRVGNWEPIVRWGFLAESTVDDAPVADSHSEVALGMDYWFRPAVPLKLAWEIHEDRDDRFVVQWAFGF